MASRIIIQGLLTLKPRSGRPMRQSWFILGHALWGTVAGGLLAISTPCFFMPVGARWLSVFINLLRAQPVGQRWRRGLAMFAVQGMALAAVLTVAALAPVKTLDRLRELPVVLPKPAMTLGELKE